MKDHVVVLTGAGISAESGLSTFRDKDGLWEKYSIEDVATPEAFDRNPELVLDFYNQRRRQLGDVEPNAAHRALADLEGSHRVTVITQNVDDLHERAGSTNVVHLHGELTKVRSCEHPNLIYHLGYDTIRLGDTCEQGSQLRPHVVWFGEAVPMIEAAAEIVPQADYLLIVGTSLQVYPAAGLVELAELDVPVTVIDPGEVPTMTHARVWREPASVGVPRWVRDLMAR
ncbi:SIR2 family NAD-dependent protein deacylase [Marinobacter zhanjiangensis]|uniref:NAD-dependent protein deacylase n=1 Tax=Marinobacter zhanjiangensis TaxID=578215 RepID=A0ABQ3B2Y4_9GAMM|nr:NAD-dependent deacylase [Marinobacter zhanjiangensis]GGY75438.1 NAD-dependent protein deacylase [Marinobacter zhanjiangensis]